jgi:hypothetical protein
MGSVRSRTDRHHPRRPPAANDRVIMTLELDKALQLHPYRQCATIASALLGGTSQRPGDRPAPSRRRRLDELTVELDFVAVYRLPKISHPIP